MRLGGLPRLAGHSVSHALPEPVSRRDTCHMPRLALLVDELGLSLDDLWSYYIAAGRPGSGYAAPFWLILMGIVLIMMF